VGWGVVLTQKEETTLNCPVCKEAMIVLELDEVEIDHCVECRGIWLDGGELEILLENSAAKDGFLDSFYKNEGSKEKPRKCPMCDKKMEKVLYGGNKTIQIDRCRKKDGIWLDKGELREILEEASYGESGVVLNLLKNMFAKKPQ
jgi:Zn-finger nucleic acid-binding protein